MTNNAYPGKSAFLYKFIFPNDLFELNFNIGQRKELTSVGKITKTGESCSDFGIEYSTGTEDVVKLSFVDAEFAQSNGSVFELKRSLSKSNFSFTTMKNVFVLVYDLQAETTYKVRSYFTLQSKTEYSEYSEVTLIPNEKEMTLDVQHRHPDESVENAVAETGRLALKFINMFQNINDTEIWFRVYSDNQLNPGAAADCDGKILNVYGTQSRSVISHEMFHVLQFLGGDSRVWRDFLFCTDPKLVEFVNWVTDVPQAAVVCFNQHIYPMVSSFKFDLVQDVINTIAMCLLCNSEQYKTYPRYEYV